MRGSELIDPMTRIPLPIAPNEQASVRPLVQGEKVIGMDNHHAAVGRAKLMEGDLGRKAVRLSRIQWTQRVEHLHGYHNDGGHGGGGGRADRLLPPLPKTEHARFLYVAMADTKFLPDACIGFDWNTSTGNLDPRLDSLDRAGREMMWERNDVIVDKPSAVNNFLAYFVSKQGIRMLNARNDAMLVKRFLDDPRDQIEPLLRRVVKIVASTSRLEDRYSAALEGGHLPPDAAPSAADHITDRLMAYTIHVGPRRGDIFPDRSPRAHLLNAIHAQTGQSSQQSAKVA